MVLVLVIGDLHIPHRCNDLPLKFKSMLVPGKIQQVLCTGNLCTKEQYDYLKKIAPDVRVVKGEFDEKIKPITNAEVQQDELPECEVVTVGAFRIGLIHGHQVVPWGDKESLAAWQRKLNCDVLVSGHTHEQKVYEYQGCLYVNPGSATGAYTPLQQTVSPSFMLMDVQNNTIVIYVYIFENNKVDVKKREHTKQ